MRRIFDLGYESGSVTRLTVGHANREKTYLTRLPVKFKFGNRPNVIVCSLILVNWRLKLGISLSPADQATLEHIKQDDV